MVLCENPAAVPQDVPQPVAPRPTTALARLAVLAAAVAIYLVILHLLRASHAVALAGLAFQYVVLLPCLFWVLLGLRDSGLRDSGLRNPGQWSLNLPALPWALAAGYLLLVLPLARHEVDWPWNVVDESCYSFQAHIFRTGRAIADPLPGATANVQDTPAELNYQNHVLTQRGWFTHFPPGWPALLVVGQWVGAPWILNPLCGLIVLALMWTIARRTFSSDTAQLSILMAVLSPFFLVNSMRSLSHMPCSALVAGACALVFRGLARKQLLPLAGAFALLAWALTIRPYTAFAEAVVLGGAALWYSREDRRFATQIAAAGAIAGLAAALVLLAYNHATTGHAAVSPYAARVGSDVPSELTFNPRLIFYFLHRWGGITFRETIFSCFPYLFLLAIYALWREREKVRETRILAAVFAVLPLAHLLHTEDSYAFFGSRFHSEGLFAALILGARGADLLAQRWAVPRRAGLALLGLLAAMQVSDVRGMVRTVWQANAPYHAIKGAVAQLDGKVPLVFLQTSDGYNARFLNFNRADWRHAPTLYLIDAEPQNRDAWACRAGRPDWAVLRLNAEKEAEQQFGHSHCSDK